MSKPKYEYYPLSGIGSALTILLMCNCLLILVSIGSDLMEINVLQRSLDGEDVTMSELEANDNRIMMLGIFWIGFELVQSIVFLKWFYRASANAHVYSARDMTYSAGWSVGWFFVPIMNLFRPYQAMKETWKVSAALPDQSPRAVSVPSIVSWWWTLWIISSISARFSFRLNMEAETYEDFIAADYVSVGDYVLSFFLSLAAIKLVRDLTRIQTVRGDQIYGPEGSKSCPVCGELIQSTDGSCPMCGASLTESSSYLDDTNPFAS